MLLIRSLFVGVCLLLFLHTAIAAIQYPFRASLENKYDYIEVVAHNDGPAIVSAIINISGSNCITDTPSPVRAVIKPRESLVLAHMRSTTPGISCQSSISTSYQVGDFSNVTDGVPFRLPFESNNEFTIGQAFGGKLTSHNSPDAQYALDITMPERTKIVAAKDGTVVDYEFSHTNSGGKEEWLKQQANYVLLAHDDGTLTQYAHLSPIPVSITLGTHVSAGQLIGFSGATGYSSGPHLHFAVLKPYIRQDGVIATCAVPFTFYAYLPQIVFVPQQGMLLEANYTSGSRKWMATALLPQPTLIQNNGRIASQQPLSRNDGAGVSSETMKNMWQFTGLFISLWLFVIYIARWKNNSLSRKSTSATPIPANTNKPSFPSLVSACLGDILEAERLIEYEIRCAPTIRRQEAITRALERLFKDRKYSSIAIYNPKEFRNPRD